MVRNAKYHQARSYAFKCCPALFRDLVHNAYISNYQKDATNLFDKPIGFIIACVRNQWYYYLQQTRFEVEGEKHQRQWISIDESEIEGAQPYTPTDYMTPDRLLIAQEFVDEFYQRLYNYHSGNKSSSVDTENLGKVVELLEAGYKQNEIAGILNTTQQRVSYWVKIVRTIAKKTASMTGKNNPLVTSLVDISKKITRKTYLEKYAYEYFYDPETCDYNEYYQIVTNGVDFILIREKDEPIPEEE